MQIVLSSTILGAFFGTLIAVASLFVGADFALAGSIYLCTALSAMALSCAGLILRRARGQDPSLAAA